MRLLDYIMWGSFLLTSIISIFTILVSFGIVYISRFATFMPIEVSLALSLMLWGINCIYNPEVKFTKSNFYIALILGGIILMFLMYGIY